MVIIERANKSVLLDISKDLHTAAYSESELIHNFEFEKAKMLIDKDVKEALSYKINRDSSGNIPTRVHNTITISGVRGSGKTSFLLSLFSAYKNHKDIYILPLIDPTLIEEKSHILVNLISRIAKEVFEKANKANCFSIETSDRSLYHKYQAWEESFKALSIGLPQIDGIGTNSVSQSDWNDYEYIMERGVKAAMAANDLEFDFHMFVKVSLDFLEKKVFLIGFDDIDTDFSKGWPLLELLRKHITTPQIISLLSGDFELYSTLVRQHQWMNFGTKIIDGETVHKGTKYKEIVSHLEDQYLLKILKPERRLQLHPIGYNIKMRNINYSVNLNNENETKLNVFEFTSKQDSIIDFYRKELLIKNGINSLPQQQVYLFHLLNLPIRTQIQLLNLLKTGTDIGDYILDVFWSSWNEWNSNPDALQSQYSDANIFLLQFLLDNRLLFDNYTLRPDSPNISISNALFVSGLYLNNLLKKQPHLVFDYWIRICLARDLKSQLIDYSPEFSKTLEDFITHCGFLTERNTRQNARLATSYIYSLDQSLRDRFVTKLGIISLPALYLTRKRLQKNQLDVVLRSSPDPRAYLIGMLPASIAASGDGKNIPLYSIFNLLGIISEIVNTVINESEKNIELDLKAEMFSIILRNSQIRTYPMPEWASVLNTVVEDNDEDVILPDYKDESNFKSESMNDFLSILLKWCHSAKTVVFPPIYVLAKIETRFFYNLIRIDNEISKSTSMGLWFHRCIIALFNSVVVELMLEDNKKDNRLLSYSANMDNPVTSDRILTENLNKLRNLSNDTSFVNWILSCPLLLSYIKRDRDVPSAFPLLSEIAQNQFGVPLFDAFPSVIPNIYESIDIINNSIIHQKKGVKLKVITGSKPVFFKPNLEEHISILKKYLKEKNLNFTDLLKSKNKSDVEINYLQPAFGYLIHIHQRTYENFINEIKKGSYR